ncbi:MAG: hypothetical protein HY919_02895 [Elusimicrobia bacterium]|nr:hypothetical protein [Elusimicrobiota bacterium]
MLLLIIGRSATENLQGIKKYAILNIIIISQPYPGGKLTFDYRKSFQTSFPSFCFYMKNINAKLIGIGFKNMPAAALDGAEIPPLYDHIGRTITSFALRGLIHTAYANLTRGNETTLFPGVAGRHLDLYSFTAINNSGNSNLVSFRMGTGGGIVHRILVPSYGSKSFIFNPPIPQDEMAAAITAQIADWGEISDSPITISAIALEDNL